MKKAIRLMLLPLVILAFPVAESGAVTEGRVSLGTLSFEVPKGWDCAAEEKRIIGKPVATDDASRDQKWYMMGSELFVMVGPEPASGRNLSAALNKFFEDAFIGYDRIDMKSFNLTMQPGIENLGLSGSVRNRMSGDLLYASVMVLRHKGAHYFFVYDIDKEDLFKKFSQEILVPIMTGMRTADVAGGSGKK